MRDARVHGTRGARQERVRTAYMCGCRVSRRCSPMSCGWRKALHGPCLLQWCSSGCTSLQLHTTGSYGMAVSVDTSIHYDLAPVVDCACASCRCGGVRGCVRCSSDGYSTHVIPCRMVTDRVLAKNMLLHGTFPYWPHPLRNQPPRPPLLQGTPPLSQALILPHTTNDHVSFHTHSATLMVLRVCVCSCRQYSPLCDVWSIGVILYFLITGGMPYTRTKDDDTVLDAILSTPLHLSALPAFADDSLQVRVLCGGGGGGISGGRDYRTAPRGAGADACCLRYHVGLQH